MSCFVQLSLDGTNHYQPNQRMVIKERKCSYGTVLDKKAGRSLYLGTIVLQSKSPSDFDGLGRKF